MPAIDADQIRRSTVNSALFGRFAMKILIVSLALVSLCSADDSKLAPYIGNNGSYSFAAGGNHMFNLTSGDAFLTWNKLYYTSKNGSFNYTGKSPVSGTDEIGEYEGAMLHYQAGGLKMGLRILIYGQGQFVRFSQIFPGVQTPGTNVSSHDDVIGGFPNFLTNKGTDGLGFLSMFDNMGGYSYKIGNFSAGSDFIRGGQRAGPLVIFDEMGNVMVLSAFSNFMAHNIMFNSMEQQLHFGVMGGATSVPASYEIDTILYFGNNGINQAIEGWGSVLAKRYGKTSAIRDNDFTIKYLGYWTDNGAFYYYQTEKNQTYEDTVLDVVKYAKTAGIPYRYIQYDSWWYYKGIMDGVKNWTARSDVFPHGMEYLFEQHGMPVAAHNRYWAADTDYAKQNGGRYGFFVEKTKAIPNDNNFWVDLLHNSSAWGLTMYEQDWLDREFELMDVTHTNINLGRDWLLQMGHGAETNRMTIQYCMALSRHMLQSIEIPVVTQMRVSSDYQPGNDQWKIGVTSMFAHALHIAPFKDTFWTTSHQNGSEYHMDEKYPYLQMTMAILSTGPVGPSDSVGMTSNIIHQTCRSDGLLLKPSRPLTTIDQRFMNLALPGHAKAGTFNPEAEIYSTYTEISYSGQLVRHGLILITDLNATFNAYPNMMYLGTQGKFVAYNGHPGSDLNVYVTSNTAPHGIPKCGRSDFQLWYFAPIYTLHSGENVAVLGEKSKVAPISPQRISYIEKQMNNLIVLIEGAPGEGVQFGFYSDALFDDDVVYINCSFGSSGKARIDYQARTCRNE